MTIEIEAGASQHQLSMKLFVVHALFRRLALEQKAIPDRCRFGAAGAIREKTDSFSKETPSLSLGLRSVRSVFGLANAAHTKSNRVRVCSTPVRFLYDPRSDTMNNLKPCVLDYFNTAETRPPLPGG